MSYENKVIVIAIIAFLVTVSCIFAIALFVPTITLKTMCICMLFAAELAAAIGLEGMG